MVPGTRLDRNTAAMGMQLRSVSRSGWSYSCWNGARTKSLPQSPQKRFINAPCGQADACRQDDFAFWQGREARRSGPDRVFMVSRDAQLPGSSPSCARGRLPFGNHIRERAFRRDAPRAPVLSSWAVGRLGSALPLGLNRRVCDSRICGSTSLCVLLAVLVALPGADFSDLVYALAGWQQSGGGNA